MSGSRCILRSATTATWIATSSGESQEAPPPPSIPNLVTFTDVGLAHPLQDISIIPCGSKLPGLNKSELNLLRRKQRQLVANAVSTVTSLPDHPNHLNALGATLIFSDYEAGTAVCIDPAGWVLTCSHCFGDTEEEWQANKRKWLLFYNGLAVQVECRVWESRVDLALAKILTIESDDAPPSLVPSFSYVTLAAEAPKRGVEIICIGQPGCDDLESSTARKTQYNLVEISEGYFRGMVTAVDPLDNSIGTLKHDAWTYWGHSGAPLLRKDDGTLVGLHSSWDDKTTMRHGIPVVAIQDFLERHFLRPSQL